MKHIYIIAAIAAFLLVTNVQAQTTVMAGDWSNPTTWGGVPPIGTGDVIINHAVNLDMDYMHSSGTITINSTGSLSSANPMRGLAFNYPSGTATLTINGPISISRVILAQGTITNNALFTCDSLFVTADLTNSAYGIINAEQFMISTNGYFENAGSVNSINFYNIDSVANLGIITTNDFCNSKRFINGNSAEVTANHDFSNIDSVAGPATLTNDGQINVGNDWHNGNLLDGSGKWCVVHNTWNQGSMNGTFDFCDQSGGNIDLQEGSVAGTITFCTTPCNVGIAEETVSIGIAPNPCQNEIVFSIEKSFVNASLTVVNSFGQIVVEMENVSGSAVRVDSKNLSGGIYFVTIMDEGHVFSGKFVRE